MFLCQLWFLLFHLILLIWFLSFLFLEESGLSFINFLNLIFSKNQLLFLLIFATLFFVSISFICALIFMISFLLLTLGFPCSSFSNCFRRKIRLFIWDFSCFLRWDWSAINFSLRSALTTSHRFSVVACAFTFVSNYMYFYFPLVAQLVKNLPEMQNTWVWSLSQEDPLDQGMTTHFSILAWRSHGQRRQAGYSP